MGRLKTEKMVIVGGANDKAVKSAWALQPSD